jgi:hypothetical protein
MMNVRGLITLLQKIPDQNMPVVVRNDSQAYLLHYSRGPEVMHVRVASPDSPLASREDMLEEADAKDERAFPAVCL